MQMTERTISKPKKIERILVPVDFSDAADSAAAFAFALAAQVGAEVRCMTVVNVLELPDELRETLTDVQTGEELERRIATWLEEAFRQLASQTEARAEHHISRGVTEDEILKVIESYGPDLVVMGSSGIAGRRPLGSRTMAVLRGTTTPVTVVR